MRMLSESVQVARRFQRSIRLEADLASPGALAGYVCQGSGQAALETMSKLIVENHQHAFTWTGPYGGGKSSLALALAQAVGPNAEFRDQARRALAGVDQFTDAFRADDEGWLVVPVVGRRADPIEDLRDALGSAIASSPSRARTKRRKNDPTGRDIIERLVGEAEGRAGNGVLVIIDEMGKFLEGAAVGGSDIHFFQELAEAAGRTSGRLIVLGVLHQSFDQYAARLGKDAREDWAKIQGRFIDIPLVAATDEVIDLLGRAIETDERHKDSHKVASRVADAIRKRRPGTPEDLANRLDACWPLHPVTASLIGPMSRRRFGQNERSVFGFLGSNEPMGFQDFLRDTPRDGAPYYDPARLWDYLRINLEPAILSSPDSHRWAQGAEVLERTEARGSALHVRLVKTVAMIELLRNGSGIVADKGIIQACLNDVPTPQINTALHDLENWSILIFRKHMDAWRLYDGSDFDIEAAVTEARRAASLDYRALAKLAVLHPILAKQHYHRTGTLRWLDKDLIPLSEAKEHAQRHKPSHGAFGKLLLVIADGNESNDAAHRLCAAASKAATDYPVAVGLPRNVWLIRELGNELIALKTVSKERGELEGDPVARREVHARISALSAELEELLRSAFIDATWYVDGSKHRASDGRTLTRLVSDLADDTFPNTPIVRSELVNRDKPSSNSQAGVRQLLHAMVNAPQAENLGISGYPAERGIYETVLQATGLHRLVSEDEYAFCAPDDTTEISDSFVVMWRATEALVDEPDKTTSLDQLYGVWSARPFGIKAGLLPILALAFIQANRSSIALYIDGRFEPTLNDFVADRILQNAADVGLRKISIEGDARELVVELSAFISANLQHISSSEPLTVARALVRFVLTLPEWTRRTTSLTRGARQVREALFRAHDPHQVLAIDLPLAVEGAGDTSVASRIAAALDELRNAYPAMLERLRKQMCQALGHRDDTFDALHKRAATVKDLTGDLRLNAFATRLLDLNPEHDAMEAIASLALNKPPRDWSDRDPDQAAIALAKLAQQFREAEAYAGVKGRSPTQTAMAVVIGTGESGRTIMDSFSVPASEAKEVADLSDAMLRLARETGLSREALLAALAQTGASLIDTRNEDKVAIAS